MIDVFIKHTWVKVSSWFYWNDKQIKVCQPNKLWFGQGREFYNNRMQKWLDNSDILMYSTHNEVKSVAAERCIRMVKSIKQWQLMIVNLVLVI